MAALAVIFSSSLKSDWSDLGEAFDDLMGKYASPWYQACRENKAAEPWFRDTTFAYSFARAQFETYSIHCSRNENKELQIPKIIHQIWLGGPLPEAYVSWTKTWQEHHPDWTYIIWGDDDLPLLPLVNKKLFDKASNFGEKSDILRLELLNLYGGLYIDTDYECYKSFDAFHYANSFYASALSLGYCGIGLCNGLVAAAPAHPLIKKLVAGMGESSTLPTLSERTGPMYFTRIFFETVPQASKGVVAYPPRYFTPGQDDSISHKEISTYANHWFACSWGKSFENERRINVNTRVERMLTGRYFEEKNNNSLVQDKQGVLSRLIESLEVSRVTELGACSFIVGDEQFANVTYKALSPVKFLVLNYRIAYPDENRSYLWKDWTQDSLPEAELLMLGDILDYLSFEECHLMLKRAIDSGAQFLLIAHDQGAENVENSTDKKRQLNLCATPFNLPKPERIVALGDRNYGIWKLN